MRSTGRDDLGRFRPGIEVCPDDFEQQFIAIGRLACEELYGVRREKVTRWLHERGKQRLIDARAAYLKASGHRLARCPEDFEVSYVRLGPNGCERRYRVSARIIRRWLNERGRERLQSLRAAETHAVKLSRDDMAMILTKAFPVPDVSLTLARHAAQFLRIRRNGGWIISPAQNGLWWVGSKRRTAAELVELAVNAGFDPANLRGEPPFGIGSDA